MRCERLNLCVIHQLEKFMHKSQREHPRFVVRLDRLVDDGWEVFDELGRCAVFGSDSAIHCDMYAALLNASSECANYYRG